MTYFRASLSDSKRLRGFIFSNVFLLIGLFVFAYHLHLSSLEGFFYFSSSIVSTCSFLYLWIGTLELQCLLVFAQIVILRLFAVLFKPLCALFMLLKDLMCDSNVMLGCILTNIFSGVPRELKHYFFFLFRKNCIS